MGSLAASSVEQRQVPARYPSGRPQYVEQGVKGVFGAVLRWECSRCVGNARDMRCGGVSVCLVQGFFEENLRRRRRERRLWGASPSPRSQCAMALLPRVLSHVLF